MRIGPARGLLSAFTYGSKFVYARVVDRAANS